MGAFYGQSASLTTFLIERDSPERFVEFIEKATMLGYDAALQKCYGIDGVAELDRQWQRHLKLVPTASTIGTQAARNASSKRPPGLRAA